MNAQDIFDKIQMLYEAELKDCPTDTYYEVLSMIEEDCASRRLAHEDE